MECLVCFLTHRFCAEGVGHILWLKLDWLSGLGDLRVPGEPIASTCCTAWEALPVRGRSRGHSQMFDVLASLAGIDDPPHRRMWSNKLHVESVLLAEHAILSTLITLALVIGGRDE